MPSIINATTTNGVAISPDNSGSLQLATNNGTTAVTIDTSQNVGIGTSSPSYRLSVSSSTAEIANFASSTDGYIRITQSGAAETILGGISTTGFVGTVTNHDFVFRTSNTERMRITSVGDVLVGTTSNPTNAKIHISTDGSAQNRVLSFTNTQASGRTYQFINGGGTAGSFQLYDDTAAAMRMGVDSSGNFQFNSGYGSSATAYGCRAWVNFNGTGTVAIRASGNVSSITDNGTGDYTVNFSTAMPDANYAASAIAQRDVGGGSNQAGFVFIPSNGSTVRQTTSAFRVMTTDQGMNVQDAIVMTVMIVR